MTLLETLICLVLIALLAGMSVFGYQHMIARTQVEADTHIIKSALAYARDQADREQASALSCQTSLCTVSSSQGIQYFTLSGKNTIVTKLFPANTDTFVFTHEGVTAFHNGTLYITAPNGHEKKVVVSQGGRISVR